MTRPPEGLSQAKEHLEALGLSEITRIPDRDLFFRVGMILSQAETPLPMGELSRALDTPLSTATRIIDGLVDKNWAARVADSEDRRVVRVTLTTKGVDLFQTIHSYFHDIINQILGQFTTEEREQLLFLLRKVVTGMKEIS